MSPTKQRREYNERDAAQYRMSDAWIAAFRDPEDIPDWDSPEHQMAEVKRRCAVSAAMLFRARALRTRRAWRDPKFDAADSNVDGPFAETTRLVWDYGSRSLHIGAAVGNYTWTAFDEDEEDGVAETGEFQDPDEFVRLWEWLHECTRKNCSAICSCRNVRL